MIDSTQFLHTTTTLNVSEPARTVVARRSQIPTTVVVVVVST